MPALIDLTGRQFGHLTVLQVDGKIGRHIAWLCVCRCGSERRIPGTNLVRSHTQSCGCLKVERNAARSAASIMLHPNYGTWCAMNARCKDEGHIEFTNYGGRGIQVCARWDSFIAFCVDMGVKPPGTSIDRIDNDKGYSKDNCRWATQKQQARNTRRTVHVEFRGERVALADLCDAFGVPHRHAARDLRAGHTVEQILKLEPRPRKNPWDTRRRLLSKEQVAGMDDMAGIREQRP
jgi:hypothetical protein